MKGSKASRTITFSSRVPTQRGVSRVLFVPKARWNLAGGASHRATPASENRPGRGGGTNPPAAHERSSATPTGGWCRRLISVVPPAHRQSSHTRSVTQNTYVRSMGPINAGSSCVRYDKGSGNRVSKTSAFPNGSLGTRDPAQNGYEAWEREEREEKPGLEQEAKGSCCSCPR